MSEQNSSSGENTKLGRAALDACIEVQRREEEAGRLFEHLAGRSAGAGADLLRAAAAEKKKTAQSLSALTGKAHCVSGLRLFLWRMLARIFGSSFVISRLEAGEKNAAANFAAAAPGMPEAEQIRKSVQEHSARLDSLMDTEGLQAIKSAVYKLYGAVILFVSMVSAFSVFFSLADAGAAALCTAAAFVFSGAATAFSARSAAGHSTALRSALLFAAEAALTALILLWPYFAFTSTWAAIPASAVMAVLLTAGLAYFAAVVRRQNYSRVFSEMILTGIGAAVLTPLFILLMKVWLMRHV